MDIGCYDRWAAMLEAKVVGIRRSQRERLFLEALRSPDSRLHGVENLLMPQWGITLGQFAYYTVVGNSSKFYGGDKEK
jgi:hypothetical protein